MHPWISPVGRSLERRRPPVFCVHYACSSLHSIVQQTPSVTGVSIRVLRLDQTRSFSLSMMAKREGIDRADIPQAGEQLERSLLEEFNCFLERMLKKYPEAWWFHWAMRDTTFGWPMLEHRMQTLHKKPLCMEEEQLVDLHAVLANDFGREFISPPQLL